MPKQCPVCQLLSGLCTRVLRNDVIFVHATSVMPFISASVLLTIIVSAWFYCMLLNNHPLDVLIFRVHCCHLMPI